MNDWGLVFSFFIYLLLFVLSLWAAKDSARNHVPFIEKEFKPYHSIIWFFLCLFICGIGFVYYLFTRGEVSMEPVPDGTTATSLEDQLAELQKLKEKGLITDAEFDQKKRQILKL